MTKIPAITIPADAQLSSIGPVEFDEFARDLWFAIADASHVVDGYADDLHRANGERGRATRSGTYWANMLADTIAQVEAEPARPVRGRINVTAGDVLASYRAAVAARDALEADEARMTAVYEARGSWPRYLQTTGTNAHIHSGTRCSTCNKTRRTPFVWLVELSGMPIEQAIKTFKVTMCTTCYPDAPVVEVAADPNVCQGSAVKGSVKIDNSGGRYSNTVRYVGDCTCGKLGIRVKQDGTPAKHKPAAPIVAAVAPATVVPAESRPRREVVTARVDEPAPVEHDHEHCITDDGVAPGCPDYDEAPAVEVFACGSCGREARMTADGPEHTQPAPHVNGIHVPTLPAAAPAGDPLGAPAGAGEAAQVAAEQLPTVGQWPGGEAPATLVPTFAPFDEIEHPGHPGVVLVVDRVTEAGKVIAHPVDDLDGSVRVLAAKCRMLRTADQAAAAKTIEDKAADLVAVARKASRTHAKGDLDRLRTLVARYGLTVKTGGHVIDMTGYHVTQGMPSLAVMLETNRSLVLRTVRAGEPIAGTWAAAARKIDQGGEVRPFVAIKSGLFGRVLVNRTVAATDRYTVELLGFGLDEWKSDLHQVGAGGVVADDVERLLRGDVGYVRALERAHTAHVRAGDSDTHVTRCRAAFLASIPVHLERGFGEAPVWCPTETPDRVTRVRTDATCRACEQAIAMHQLMTGLRSDQREGRPVRDALGGVIDVPDGITVDVDYRLFWAGRVIGECGHPVARSEYQAGLKSCERCPAGGQDDDDQDDDDQDDERPGGHTHPAPCGYPDVIPCICRTDQGDEQDDEAPAPRVEMLGAGRLVADVLGLDADRAEAWAQRYTARKGHAPLDMLGLSRRPGEAAAPALVPSPDSDIDEAAATLGRLWAAGQMGVDRPTFLLVMARMVEIFRSEGDAAAGEAADALEQLAGLVEAQQPAAAAAAQDVEVPALPAGSGFTVADGTEIGGTVGSGKSVSDPWAGLRKQVVETTWEALESLLRMDGFVPTSIEGHAGRFLAHPCGVNVSVDGHGVTLTYPDDNIGDGEYGEGVSWVRLALGNNYGAIRDAAVGLVAVVGGTAVAATPGRDAVNELLDLVGAYGQAAAIGGDTASGVEAMAEAKMQAGERFLAVRSRLVELLFPAPASAHQHVTTIDEQDSAGHWGWHCLAPAGTHPDGGNEGSGYESADEVIEAATAHGPLAADSLRPVDDDQGDAGEWPAGAVEAVYLDVNGVPITAGVATGSQLEIGGTRYAVPDRTPNQGILAPARIVVALRTAGYVPARPDYYGCQTTGGMMVVPAPWGAAVRDVRAQVEDALEAAGRHGLVEEEIRADLVEYAGEQLAQLPIKLLEVLDEMYAEEVILASELPLSATTRFYATGVPCVDCETAGKNCLPHRSRAQRVRDSW